MTAAKRVIGLGIGVAVIVVGALSGGGDGPDRRAIYEACMAVSSTTSFDAIQACADKANNATR